MSRGDKYLVLGKAGCRVQYLGLHFSIGTGVRIQNLERIDSSPIAHESVTKNCTEHNNVNDIHDIPANHSDW